MRFDSIEHLLQFLMVLSNLGYLIPFKDYREDFKNSGIIKHIHNYKCKVLMPDIKHIIIEFTIPNKEPYKIILERN